MMQWIRVLANQQQGRLLLYPETPPRPVKMYTVSVRENMDFPGGCACGFCRQKSVSVTTGFSRGSFSKTMRVASEHSPISYRASYRIEVYSTV